MLDSYATSYYHQYKLDAQHERSNSVPIHPSAAMTQREDVIKFEQGRIKALQEERLAIQKKTFTKWMNSFLLKARMEVEDLFTDLADGKKLLKLLEIISGEKLGKPNNGRMRVHKVENVNKSLAFLHTKVRLESIGAEDIVDGNPRLILGLIWTIILRFQIQEIEIDVDEENESSEKKSAKDALLLWCQRKTNGYPGVNIQDFTGSWRTGLGFNALIHAHRPDLFDFSSLHPNRNIDNLNHAFDMAHSQLGIPRLLDAEDVDQARPDEKSIITYVASYYHTFARMKNEMKSGRRIANIVGQMMDADKQKLHYARLTTTLLEWIRQKVEELEDRHFPNSLEGIQKELLRFKQYRTIEKPPKYNERSEIEVLYFHLQTQLKSLNQPGFVPSDGQLVQDLERAWVGLEQAEHQREVALRQELLRQQRLEQLNYKFEKKSVLREGYLKEMIQVLSDPRYGSNLAQVDATIKKHEAISADILAREERFHDLTNMAEELMAENYHGSARVKRREAEVLQRWKELLALLGKHKTNLTQLGALMTLLRECETVMTSIAELQTGFESSETGPHLLAVEDLLQKHSLAEGQVTTMGESQRRLARQGIPFVQGGHREAPLVQQRLDRLDRAYQSLVAASQARRALLEDARNFFQFVQDHEEEESWLVERQRICQAGISAKDLRAVASLQQKHKALEDEANARRPKSEQLAEAGRKLIRDKHPRSNEIRARLDSAQEHWKRLMELAATRRKQLEDAAEAYQFYTDANEAESWLNEKMALVTSQDFGNDEPSAQALLQRHRDLQGEINAYNGDIQSLQGQARKLIQAGITTLELWSEPEPLPDAAPVEEWVNEVRLIPQDFWEEEPYERVEKRVVLVERSVPQVRALYDFRGQGMFMTKGEEMLLLNKTNSDWWNVHKNDGTEGFVPANYVSELEPRIVKMRQNVPETIREVRRVKKTRMVKQLVPVRREATPRPAQRRNSAAKRAAQTPGGDGGNASVQERQANIDNTYKQLLDQAQKRHNLLEDAIRLYAFFRECDAFEKWLRDKEKLLRTEDDGPVEIARRKYETFLTDLSASGKRIEAIDTAVEQFVQQGHSQLDKVKARQRQIHQLWDHLNWLKQQKEKSLEGASSVELFNRTCDEARDWMLEKMTQLDTAELGPDLKTVQALQRRHKQLERELAPVEEKVNRVMLLGNSVQSSYPTEKANVLSRQREIQDLWARVQNKALERRSRLEDAVGQQIFGNSSRSLLAWTQSMLEQLNTDETARDVATAEKLLKHHQDLGDEIRAREDEFREVIALGSQLLVRAPGLTDVQEVVKRLEAEHVNILRVWSDRGERLQQCYELQMFNREGDQIDATTGSHELFLANPDLGGSLDDVEALLKRHEDFENTLVAQDERVKAFSEVADQLISLGHYDSPGIDEKRKQVIARREAVRAAALVRRQALHAARAFQEFSADAADLDAWIGDKLRTASDESYRELTNLERKLQKHEAFERELRANEGQLRTVNKIGEGIIAEGNPRSGDVKEMLESLVERWQQLADLSKDKGRRLRQAAAQRTYNRTLEDARHKLDELSQALDSNDVGNDLRNCKQLLQKHQQLESDMGQWQQRVADLVAAGEEMAAEGHFDAPAILEAGRGAHERFTALQEPARRRRAALEESLRFHKFCFELDAERQWVQEHAILASSETLGANLHQAQSLYKKHRKLEAEIKGHQPMIDRALASGRNLIQQKHPESEKIENLCQDLTREWEELDAMAHERAHKLELSLKAQQFYFEASEVENWLAEKNDVLSSTDVGRDRDAATKLLTRHKVVELELDTYGGIVSEMGHTAATMVSAKHPDAKALAAKQQVVQQQLRTLQKLAAARQQRLMESMYRHEYFLESAELESWIREQQQAAASEDYGHDYEHLLILQNKFDDLKHRAEAGSERVAQCEALANKLIANDSPHAEEISKRQEQLGDEVEGTGDDPRTEVANRHTDIRMCWQNLLETLQHREQRLHAAGEIHRFHRDVAEALSRIQEKDAALPDDLGRDLNAVLSLLRRHEGFENDLVAVEAQLQVLVEDAARLQALYPGQNAARVAQQQEAVLAAWNALQERAAARREALHASCDLHRFLAQTRDLMSWSSGLRAAMLAEERVRDAASAQALKAEHEAMKAEIEAREDSFKTTVELGQTLMQDGHPSAQDIKDRVDQLLDARQTLHTAWQHKKVHLDQLIDWHFFLRDAKQMDTLSGTQEVALQGAEQAASVEEADTQLKRHDAFEKLLATQEDKVTALQEHGAKLLEQNHFESPAINRRLHEVVTRRGRVRELAGTRRLRLEDALLHAQFGRDVAEAQSWIADKQKKLEAESAKASEVTSLDDKMKKLQKHQAFQAELAAHESRIHAIREKGETLIAKRHKAAREIRSQLEQLLTSWRRLLQESANTGRGLEEAHDILEFNNHVDKTEAWIRDKEMLVQAGDTGTDYEHCLALQRRLDDVDSDMRVDDGRIKAINALADKLVRQGRNEARAAQQRRDELNARWRALQGALGAYRERLAGALEVHAFDRDVDDTRGRVHEKISAMQATDVGKDLPGVEQLRRKQDALERDVSAIEEKIREHEQEARRLVQKYNEHAAPIRNKLAECQEAWRSLQQAQVARRDSLAAAHAWHKFQAELNELDNWVNDAVNRMSSPDLPATITEAEAALELHQERKAEIDGRQDTFKVVKEFGLRLSAPPKLVETDSRTMNDEDEAVSQSLSKLEELRRTLGAAWEERKQRLVQAHQWQLFRELADRAEAWLAGKEAFLNNDDLGDSLSAVEALIRKHEAFEKTATAQAGRVDELERLAAEYLAERHYAGQAITERLQAVCARRDRLSEAATARRLKLRESAQLHQFLRNMYEAEAWIHQKQQVASDESYRDPTNLQSKLQRHAAFEAELSANRSRVGAVTAEGEALVEAGHFAGMEIQARLTELDMAWQQLLASSQLKRDRLNEAYQALLFGRSLDELDAWMDEVEAQLASEDHGKDLASVQHLLKRHGLLEADVTGHGETTDAARDQAAAFQRQKHFMSEELAERAQQVVARYRSLQEPMQIRRENLEDALLLQQLLRDMDDEVEWVTEREPLACSIDLGSSLADVQALQKKHQSLEAELAAREPLQAALQTRAQQMVRAGHFASNRIEQRIAELTERLAGLRDLASVRRLRLLDAVESQMFYAEANEAAAWLRERRPGLASHDRGKDEDSARTLQKRLEGAERDLSAFQHNIGRLAKQARGLVDRGHFDAAGIEAKQAEIELQFSELQYLASQRRARLDASLRLFRFLREADEVSEWMGDQTAIAASEDYGRDVEHVELLIQTFDTFVAALNANEPRVTFCLESGKILLKEATSEEGNNDDVIRIHSKLDELSQLWEDLRELAHARQEALAGAKQVHMFDRTADETIAWIEEKQAALLAEDYGQDLETVQALVRRHQGYEADLDAVKEQVETVGNDASRLSELFPDAREHVDVKQEEAAEAWMELLAEAAARKDKLQQAEQLQAYFDQHRDLMAWVSETLARVTAPDLARDVSGAEALLARHGELRAEIDSRSDAFEAFYDSGAKLIKQGHFLSAEVEERISALRQRHQLLIDTWSTRHRIYEQSLDAQIFIRDAALLDKWLVAREPVLRDERFGESIPQVEDLIRKHDDFEKTIEAQADKFSALRRLTLLETALTEQRRREAAARQAERERQEKERIEARKRKEVERITEERRKKEDRRRLDVLIGEDNMNDRSFFETRLEPRTYFSSQPVLPKLRRREISSSFRLPNRDAEKEHDSPMPLRRTGSVSQMFGDQMRRDLKRAESMKAELKKPKRTPSFTTRRRTQSFRKLQRLDHMDQLPPVEIQAVLDRKQELQSGGKKAPVRSWKTYYTVLCGQLLCFFKDQDDFVASKAACAPIIILGARCEKASDYTKRKHVFRLSCTDNSEYLFLASNDAEMEDWINKISFHARLPPQLQLLSYDESLKNQQSPGQDRLPSPGGGSVAGIGGSSASSRASSPEPPPVPMRAPPSSSSSSAATTTTTTPIPTTPVGEMVEVTLRHPSSRNNDHRPLSHQPMMTANRPTRENGAGPTTWRRSHDFPDTIQGMPPPPPLMPPPLRPPPPPPHAHQPPPHHLPGSGFGFSGRQQVSPPYVPPPQPPQFTNPASSSMHAVTATTASSTTTSLERRPSESSTDSLSQDPARTAKDKRSSVLSGFFRKKRATHL